jgi:DNA-3-methyladenine glycosylase
MVAAEVSALPPDFYARDTVDVAWALLGCVLVTTIDGQVTSGRVVEVEAYVGPDDPAAHGYGNRRTRRNAALFGPPGTSYVYFIYGMHWCFNAVTERDGFPSAVLIRALEPVSGLASMVRRRGTEDERLLCSGPARLCQALRIDGELNARPLSVGPVKILLGTEIRPEAIGSGPRIGITRAADWPLRFFLLGSRWLSRPGAQPLKNAD